MESGVPKIVFFSASFSIFVPVGRTETTDVILVVSEYENCDDFRTTLEGQGTFKNSDVILFSRGLCRNGWADWAGFWNWVHGLHLLEGVLVSPE